MKVNMIYGPHAQTEKKLAQRKIAEHIKVLIKRGDKK